MTTSTPSVAPSALKWDQVTPPQPGQALTTIVVTDISPNATEKNVRDFFVYCGAIVQFELQSLGDTKAAFIEFEKESAARTALLLTSAVIVDKPIVVSWFGADSSPYVAAPAAGDQVYGEASASAPAPAYQEPPAPTVVQEQRKFANKVVAEILADGYILSEQVIQRAKRLDEQYKILERVQTTTSETASRAAEVVRGYAEKYNLQSRINQAVSSMEEVDKKYHVRQNVDYVATSAASIASTLFGIVSQKATEVAQTDFGKQVTGIVANTSQAASTRLAEIRATTDEIIKERAPPAPAPNIVLQDPSSVPVSPTSPFPTAVPVPVPVPVPAPAAATDAAEPGAQHVLPPYSEVQGM